MNPPAPSLPPDRRRIAAEVVELGQTLFDAVLDAAAGRLRSDADLLPEAELRDASEEFFRAVRTLLDLPPED